MIKHLLVSGLLAGFVVALVSALLQFSFVEQGILLAERYESGELQHFGGTINSAGPVQIGSEAAVAAIPFFRLDDASHESSHAEPFLMRQAKTILSMTVTYCGYGLVLVAGFSFAGYFGKEVDHPRALLWGLAGFVAFYLAPAMGLEPTLPGVEGAELSSRQFWWLLCGVATAAGLALLVYGKGTLPRIAGVMLLAIPHIIGAPHLADFTGILPPELAARHAARSLGVGLVAWVSLGGLTHRLWSA